MATRSIALLVALAAITAACGSDGTATSDTLPTLETAITEVPVSALPVTDVPVTEVPSTGAPVPVTQAKDAPDPTIQAELDAARESWAAQGPTSYTIVTQSLCFCPAEQWSDTVVDGVVTEHVALSDDVFSDPAARPMDVLFEFVQQAIDNGYASLTVSYDPNTGALTQFYVDVDEMMADEEYGVEVIFLEPIG
jgi:hypothetical protein